MVSRLTKTKIEWYQKTGRNNNVYASVPLVLNNIVSFDIKLGIGNKADVANFKVYDEGETLFNLLNSADKIDIFISEDGGSSYTQIFGGVLKNKTIVINDNGLISSFDCINLFEKIFKSIVPYGGSGVQKTAGQHIQDIISEVNQANKGGIQIGWSGSNDSTTTKVGYVKDNMAAHRMISELSSKEFNKEANFYSKVDENYNFIWKKIPTAITGSLAEGTLLTNLKVGRNANSIVNQLIINCGNYPKNNVFNILTQAYDLPSAARDGLKSKYVDRSMIAQEMIEKDVASHGNTDPPLPTTFPYRTSWSSLDGSGPTLLTTSESDYITKFVEEARFRGKKWGDTQLITLIKPNWTLSTELATPTINYALGGRYAITSYSVGWPIKELILLSLTHKFNTKGWKTTLNFKEFDIEEGIF